MPRQFSLFAGFFARVRGPLLGLALCLLWSTPARAYEEQASVDVALGYAAIVGSDRLHPHLGAIDVGASLGISDFLVLRAALGYGPLLERHQKTQHGGRGRVELAYLIDILKWVPFFGLGVGVWGVGDRGELSFYASGHAIVGLDYLVTRGFTLGADVRVGMLLESGSLVSWTEGQLRSSFMFELF